MLLKNFLLKRSPVSAILLGSILLSTTFISPIQAMDEEIIQSARSRFSSKDQLEDIANGIDTIVIGGIREQTAGRILSGPNCLTINTDGASDPDFRADGFSQKLTHEIPILFDVFGKNGKHFGKIKKIIYEHVGLGIDVEKPDAFIALNSLLSSGGSFEYTSFWEYVSYSSYESAVTQIDSKMPNATFLNQTLRFKTSYLNPIVQYDPRDLEKAKELKEALEVIEKKEIAAAIRSLNNEQPTKEVKYIDLINFQQDNPESLWKSKAYSNKHNEYLKFVTTMKSTPPKRIMGLDDRMESFFIHNPGQPYVVDLEKDKEFFCQNSLLETNPRFFEEILKLENVKVSFRKKQSNSNVMCFSVIGIKKP